MQQIITKVMLMVLAVLMLVPSIVIGKTIDNGETLNLKPYVDFEVKEKQKVDVIVDIGNVSYTEIDVNNIINNVLKPQLSAKGLDYNITVKNSNEGISEIYFVNRNYYLDNTNKQESGLGVYSFNLNTKEVTQISNTLGSVINYQNIDRATALHDTKNNALWYFEGYNKTSTVFDLKSKRHYSVSGGTSQGVSPTSSLNKGLFYFNDNSIITFGNFLVNRLLDQTYYNIIQYKYELKYDPLMNTYSVNYVKSDNLMNSKDYSYQFVYWKEKDQFLMHTIYGYQGSAQYGNMHLINDVHNPTPNGQPMYTEFKSNGVNGMARTAKTTRLYPIDDKHILYAKVRQGYYNGSTMPFGFDKAEAYILNIDTKEEKRASQYDSMFRDDYITTKMREPLANGKYVSIYNSAFYLSDKEYERGIKITDIEKPSNVSIKAVIGNNIIYTKSNDYIEQNRHKGAIYLLNGETLEHYKIMDLFGEKIYRDGRYSYQSVSDTTTVFKTALDVENRVLVKDIINQNLNRYDADTYYIRLDDGVSEQFMSAEQSTEIANLLRKNNMTFIGIGNSEAKNYHDSMLATLDGNGKTILNSNDLNQAMIEATQYIVNKKEVDLHVIDTGSTNVTQTTINQAVAAVKRDLRVTNHIIKSSYSYSTTEDIFTLLNHLSWDDRKNNVVVVFNGEHLVALQNEEYQALVASTLEAHRAYMLYVSGNEQDEASIDTIIELNGGKGIRSTSTSLSSLVSNVKNIITDHAVTNPVQHIRKLVLQHNPVTDEFSSEIDLQAFYFDEENDRKKAERFKTEHNPTFYENHTGLMAGTGTYMNSAITRFTKVGKYEIVAQMQDDPTQQAAFQDEYSLWSEDSLSRLVLYVHRQPVANFQAYFMGDNQLTIQDLSYDLDFNSLESKGIIAWQWKYKKASDSEWTTGKPTQLQAGIAHMISLKVQDMDGEWSNEQIKVVGVEQPPVALFDLSETALSWARNPTLTDQSYSPLGRAITSRNWRVYREGQLITTSSAAGINFNTIKTNALTHFSDVLGDYTVELVVTDSTGLSSAPYSATFSWLNYEPIPLFEVEQPLYRDTLTTIVNNTSLLDLDGEVTTFDWTFKKGSQSFSRTGHSLTFKVKDFGISKNGVGKWEVTLSAKDMLNQEGKLSKEVTVLNHIPTSTIIGDATAYLHDMKTYRGQPEDKDSEDGASLVSYWKVTKPSGQIQTSYTRDLTLAFDEKGEYSLLHWVVDQLEAKSEVYTKAVTVLNKAPVADFTMTPNLTYRGIPITFESLSYDVDGYIKDYRFELEKVDGTREVLSNNEKFKRAIQSQVGTLTIVHSVTDDDNVTAVARKELKILNHKPVVTLQSPSSQSQASPTQFSTLSPSFKWSYDDGDGDKQVKVRLSVEQQQGNTFISHLVREVTTSEHSYDALTFSEDVLYRISVQAFDGYEWGEWSGERYFKIVLNQPPTAAFTSTPETLYEGDTVSIFHQVDDNDEDNLNVSYILTTASGKQVYFPSKTSNYQIDKQSYSSFAFSYTSEIAEEIEITQFVSDGTAPPVYTKKSISFLPLTLTADVLHTDMWESYRQNYNETAQQSKRWGSKQFYAGEKFILVAQTTLFDYIHTDTTVMAKRMTVYFPFLNLTIQLKNEHKSDRFSGEFYVPALSKLKNGSYVFDFIVIYSNGTTKTAQVEIEIIGEAISFIGVHRLK